MMDIQQAKYHLKRIQAIIDLQDQDLSELDRNILLEDIRKLYEIVVFSETKEKNTADSEVLSHPPSAQKKENPAPVAQEATPGAEPLSSDTSPDPVIEKTPPSAPFKKPTAPAIPPVTEETPLSEKESSAESIKETHEIETIHPPSNDRSNQYAPSGNHQNDTISQEIETTETYSELFDFKATDDLSEKLGNSRVDQLNHILAINDKILYINHLFGGEAIPFQESLKKFESFYTYEEAKSYASEELVEKYQWTDPGRIETVKQFMKQVRRLYS